MKKIFLTLSLILISIITTFAPAYASKLPDDLWNYTRAQFPNATQRFDSIVVISDKVMYIPLYPAQKADVEKIEVDYTYPEGKSFKSLPEVVIFNDNFVFMKLYKDKDGKYTITKHEDLPLKVKLGVMPQDMLVPPGLKIPENLKLILGDLIIPSVTESAITLDKTSKEDKKLAGQIKANEFSPENDSFYALNELKGRKAYITSNGSKFMSVYDETSAHPMYELKLNALPAKIAASNHSKFAVALYYGEHSPEVIDLRHERILSEIDLIQNPKDVLIDNSTNLAYISAPLQNTIYAVDILTGNVMKEIKLAQQPYKMAFNKDKSALAYTDFANQKLHVIELSEEYDTRFLAKTRNICFLSFIDETVYTVSRTQNSLIAYDYMTGAIKEEVLLHKKPTDALLYNNKIFILCAQDSTIDIYDIAKRKITKSVKLDKTGFYANLTKIPTDNFVFVTGVNTKKFLIFDLISENIVQNRPFEINVSNMIIIDK